MTKATAGLMLLVALALPAACAGHQQVHPEAATGTTEDAGTPMPPQHSPPDGGPVASTIDTAPDIPNPADHPHPSHIGEYPGETWPNPQPPDPAPPIKPTVDIKGCGQKIDAYAKALEKHAEHAQIAELKKLGAVWVDRDGFFVEDEVGGQIGKVYEVKGKRFAVMGSGDPYHHNATVRLAKIGNTLHQVTLAPHHYPAPITACGVRPCTSGRGARAYAKSISIELSPTEKIGEPIFLHYESWWAHVSYTKSLNCPPPPPMPRGR